MTLIGLANGQHLLVTEDMVRIYESEDAVRLAQPTNYMQRHPLAGTDDSAETPTDDGDQADAEETTDEGEGGRCFRCFGCFVGPGERGALREGPRGF